VKKKPDQSEATKHLTQSVEHISERARSSFWVTPTENLPNPSPAEIAMVALQIKGKDNAKRASEAVRLIWECARVQKEAVSSLSLYSRTVTQQFIAPMKQPTPHSDFLKSLGRVELTFEGKVLSGAKLYARFLLESEEGASHDANRKGGDWPPLMAGIQGQLFSEWHAATASRNKKRK
jgi:hypothetical protein